VKVLVIDIGGTNVKLLATGRRTVRKIPSGPALTPRQLVAAVLPIVAEWKYDAVSIGLPAPVRANRAIREPVNLGKGWVRFDFEKAFGRPVRMVNDAAMQALGSYRGRRMLFLGLGTGLGTTLVQDGVVVPLELAHLPYQKGQSFEDYIGELGYQRWGKLAWRKHVAEIVRLLMNATVADYVVLGGGNVRHLKVLPPRARRGSNANAFRGGYRMWQKSTTWT
jgi:ROK family